MSGRPLREAKRAAEGFVSQCDLSNTSIGLISFSDAVHVDLVATQNGKAIYEAVRQLSIGRTGYANAGHPFDVIYQRLNKIAGLRYAVVLADGVWSHQHYAIQRAQRCHQASMEIIAIGFGGADRYFLQQIASSTEQSFFTDMNRLTEMFSTIAQELTESLEEKPRFARLQGRRTR
jgi:glycerophosphoryl diester phosphodiesterase